jgi:PPOX class probable F420-dependent enzyme
MSLSEQDREFLARNRAAVMVTLKADGTPHVARVGVGLVDDKLWSSGTQDRVRTSHLRRDPRCTLFVFDPGHAYRWLGLETTVTILDGPDAPQLNLALYRALAGEPDDVDEYLRAMVTERRLIYEFDVTRSYGMR